jgi:hypothetical protein
LSRKKHPSLLCRSASDKEKRYNALNAVQRTRQNINDVLTRGTNLQTLTEIIAEVVIVDLNENQNNLTVNS